MKKILIVSTVSRQFYLFEQGNIEELGSLGFEIHAAANYNDANERLNNLNIIRHHFDIERSPFSPKNIKAYKQLIRLMKEEKFDVVHCHSPIGGVLARLAAKSVGITTVIYTAHGFHFYKGAPIINWLLYYPIERWLARYTDVLITINKEDYNYACSFNTNKVINTPGIGVDRIKYSECKKERKRKRNELNISEETVVLLSVGEMIKRKNHEVALKALSEIKDLNFLYLICGRGELETYLKDLAKTLQIESKVVFLGYRSDIPEICAASDAFIFPSYQEGLPVSIIEAMSAGLPIICSSIRGNIDLIENGSNGFLINANDVSGFAHSIREIILNDELRAKLGRQNSEDAVKYDKSIVKRKMREVYKRLDYL